MLNVQPLQARAAIQEENINVDVDIAEPQRHMESFAAR